MEKIRIGRISGAAGMKGEVKLFHDSGDSERLSGLVSLFLFLNGTEREYRILALRMQKRTPIMRLSGVEDRSAAEALIGAEVFADKEALRPTEAGAYFVSDLIGLAVVADSGLHVGVVKDIIANPAHDILEIKTPEGSLLLPMVDAYVLGIDPEKGLVFVKIPEM